MNILKKIVSTALFAAFAIAPTFAYGGGGGGGGVNYSNPSLVPSISNISPLKSSLQPSSFPISFVVQGNASEDSILVQVNGEEVPTTVSSVAGGALEVFATVRNLEGTSALIKISAASRYSSSSVRTYIYPVSIFEGSESSSVLSVNTTRLTNRGEDEAPAIRHEVVLFNAGVKQNLCDAGETFNDNSHSSEIEYSDISGNKNEKYIRDLTQRCIVHGEKGDTFKPNKIFNRAAAVKTVVKAFGYQYDESISVKPFADVQAFEWFAPYIATAKKYGIVKGYAGGKFAPDNGMNIVEGLAIVARASKTDLSDYRTGSGVWYNSYLKWGIAKGLIDKGTQPQTPLSRGAFARMVSLR